MKPDSDTPIPLVFDWKKPRRAGLSLLIWLLITSAAMGVFFYIFKVVYPQSQRFTPIPQQIFVLNPDDLASQPLLNRVRDHDYLVLSGNEDASREVRLDDHAPLFHPSFEKHEFALQDLPHKTFSVSVPRLLDTTAPILPPPDLSELKKQDAPASIPAVKPELTLQFTESLSKRKLVNKPDLSRLPLPDAEAYRFHIGVEEDGRVAYALPIATSDKPKTTQQLLDLLTGLQFEPLNNEQGTVNREPVSWSIATLHWSTAP